jgi:adenosylhomocysteine nucleosidase
MSTEGEMRETTTGRTLVCFALKEEAAPFQRLSASRPDVAVLVTGMGRRNAERALRAWLERETPRRVFTCGFAGALNPEFKPGDVAFSTLQRSVWDALQQRGARSAYFFTSDRVVTTAAEKADLRNKTRKDVVEMESAALEQVCRERKIPCSIVRVISDAADEDLPLDFNRLANDDASLNYGKLAWAVLKSPGKLAALWRLRQRTRLAAQRLAEVLAGVV